jgi:hypothetical protein
MLFFWRSGNRIQEAILMYITTFDNMEERQ